MVFRIFALCISLAMGSDAFTLAPFRVSPPKCNTNIRLRNARPGGDTTPRISGQKNEEVDKIRDMLWKMTSYFVSMVDPTKRRFYALSRPQSGELVHVHCPIRDMGAAWDATTALTFWKDQEEWLLTTANDDEYRHPTIDVLRQRLLDGVYGTLDFYGASYVSVMDQQQPKNEADGGCVALDSSILLEPSNIAHSAFCLMTTVGALRLSDDPEDELARLPPVNALVRGILSMQRPDGAFRIEFGTENVHRGIEFYPGEAMVALMEVYHISASMPAILDDSTRDLILLAMKQAFHFYADFYHRGEVDTNYNIWQVQAFARLFDTLAHGRGSEQDRNHASVVADYVLELCQNIVNSRSWKELNRGRSFYPNLQTVEIACGLDAIAQGVFVASQLSRDSEERVFRINSENAVDFLKAVQDQVPPGMTGSGGIGYGGIQVLEQRLDVSGHAISALTKMYQVQE